MWLYLHCVPKASSCAKLNLSHLNLVESRVCGPFIGRTAGAPLTHLCTSHVWKQDLFYGCRGGLERFPSAGVASRKLQRRRVHVSKLNSSRSPHSENDGKNILIRFLAEKQCFNVTLRFQRGGGGVNAGFFSNAVSLWGLSYFLKPDGGRLCLEWLSDPVSKAAHIHFPTQAVIY